LKRYSIQDKVLTDGASDRKEHIIKHEGSMVEFSSSEFIMFFFNGVVMGLAR